MDKGDLPLGFAFALAQNPDAMKQFSSLTEAGQAEVLQRAHGVASKKEMQSLVNDLTTQS